MKTKLALLCLVVGALAAFAGLQITSSGWQSLVVGLGTNIFVLGIGIVIVNQYLESDSRKGAVRALLVLSERSVTEFHNSWLTICWAKFGKEAYDRIGDEYLKADGKPDALRAEDRKDIYELYKNAPSIQQHISSLEESLVELSRMAGWSLSSDLLQYCLEARISIAHLRTITLDDSEEAKTKVTEHILDIDMRSGIVRRLLMKLADIEDDNQS